MPKAKPTPTNPTFSSLTPTQRRELFAEYLTTLHTTLWGQSFMVDKRSGDAADYLCSQVERFEEWLASRGES